MSGVENATSWCNRACILPGVVSKAKKKEVTVRKVEAIKKAVQEKLSKMADEQF